MVGLPFSTGEDARRNKGGRPKGLAKTIREKTGDFLEFVEVMMKIADGSLTTKCVIGKGESQEIIEVPPSNKDRISAIEWLADRAYGKAVDVTATVDATDEQRDEIKKLAKAIYEERTNAPRN